MSPVSLIHDCLVRPARAIAHAVRPRPRVVPVRHGVGRGLARRAHHAVHAVAPRATRILSGCLVGGATLLVPAPVEAPQTAPVVSEAAGVPKGFTGTGLAMAVGGGLGAAQGEVGGGGGGRRTNARGGNAAGDGVAGGPGLGAIDPIGFGGAPSGAGSDATGSASLTPSAPGLALLPAELLRVASLVQPSGPGLTGPAWPGDPGPGPGQDPGSGQLSPAPDAPAHRPTAVPAPPALAIFATLLGLGFAARRWRRGA